MLDNRPIGVFDSGLGGLTAVKELRRLLPMEEIVYFGDTGRVPYGGRSRETILKYARQDIEFLSAFDLKAIMVACGTVSTTALETVKGEYPLPIFGVVEPAVRRAAELTRNGKVGLIGTPATVKSGLFQRLLEEAKPGIQVTAAACPLFVPLVEAGRVFPGDVVIETVVREYLAPIRAQGVDTLILGCTHYPLLAEVIGAEMGPEVDLVNSGAEGARYAAQLLREQNALARREQPASCRYYVSDRVEDFSGLASLFLGESVDGMVEKVEIGQS